MQAMEISLTGLDVEWRRLEIISQNLANADIAASGKATPYQAQRLLSGPRNDFSTYLDTDHSTSGIDVNRLGGVAEYGLKAENAPPHLVHEPANPHADANGFVAYPSIDHAEQMVSLVKTERAYEANIVAMNTAREMYSKALSLGGRS